MVVSRKSRSLKRSIYIFFKQISIEERKKSHENFKKINTLQFMWNNKNYPLPPTDSYLD